MNLFLSSKTKSFLFLFLLMIPVGSCASSIGIIEDNTSWGSRQTYPYVSSVPSVWCYEQVLRPSTEALCASTEAACIELEQSHVRESFGPCMVYRNGRRPWH